MSGNVSRGWDPWFKVGGWVVFGRAWKVAEYRVVKDTEVSGLWGGHIGDGGAYGSRVQVRG